MVLFKSGRRAVALLLFILLGLIGLSIPSSIFPNWLHIAFNDYVFLDKVCHAALFFTAVVCTHWATFLKRRTLMMLSLFFAAITEISQYYIEGRSASWGDLLADAGGGITAVWVIGVFSVFVGTKRGVLSSKRIRAQLFKRTEKECKTV